MNNLNVERSPNREAAGTHTQTAQNKTLDPNNTATSNQRAIVLAALREEPKTTIQLRHDYGIMMPGSRIKELRDRGNRIETIRVIRNTPDGISHYAVALYVLQEEART